MAGLKRRDRIVVFRLTQDEYDSLKEACVRRGGLNISSFARSEMLTILNRDGLADVGRQLSKLQVSVQRVTEIFESIAGPKEST